MAKTIVTFNNFNLSEVMKITDIQRPIGNVRSIITNDAPILGVNVQDFRIGPKIIKVKFTLKGSALESKKHELASVLSTPTPSRLLFSDEPDKYYLAMVTGTIDPDNVKSWYQRGTIEFLIPDGVAHSTAYRRFAEPTVSSDKLTFNLTNSGNVDAYPIVTVRHNAENGYVGLVNVSGASEVGDRQEADVATVKQSELLFDYRDSRITTGLSAATKTGAILNDNLQRQSGTISSKSVWGRQHLYLSNPGGTTGNNAGTLTWTIPADSTGATGSLNDYIWWRQIFWLGAANQYGFIKLTVSDEQGRFLYGVETYKRSNGLGCEYNFMASDGKGGYNMIKRWTFTGTHENRHNPFNEPRGWSDLKRNDDKVTVFWWGSYTTFTIPEIKGRKSAKIHVALGAIGNRPLVTHMYLDSIFYRKDFVSTTKDLPNRYPIGSNLIINSENDTVIVDGIERLEDLVDGSAFLKIPPGNSQLEVYTSSWLKTKPTVSVSFEERWL